MNQSFLLGCCSFVEEMKEGKLSGSKSAWLAFGTHLHVISINLFWNVIEALLSRSPEFYVCRWDSIQHLTFSKSTERRSLLTQKTTVT